MSDNRKVLHTVNKSPFEKNSLAACLRLAAKGSAVLLIEDGVLAALSGTAFSDEISGRMDDFAFYALGPDLDARGLSGKPLVDGITVVDYAGFVDLAAEHDASQAWL